MIIVFISFYFICLIINLFYFLEEDESSFRDKPPCMKQDLPLRDMEKKDKEDDLMVSLESFLALYDIRPQIIEEVYDEI